jgi:hypothetical protein
MGPLVLKQVFQLLKLFSDLKVTAPGAPSAQTFSRFQFVQPGGGAKRVSPRDPTPTDSHERAS